MHWIGAAAPGPAPEMDGVSTPSASTMLVISSVAPSSRRCAKRLLASCECSHAPTPRSGLPCGSPAALLSKGALAGRLPVVEAAAGTAAVPGPKLCSGSSSSGNSTAALLAVVAVAQTWQLHTAGHLLMSCCTGCKSHMPVQAACTAWGQNNSFVMLHYLPPKAAKLGTARWVTSTETHDATDVPVPVRVLIGLAACACS